MKKRVTDLTAFCICLAAIGIILLYPNQVRGREAVLVIAGYREIVDSVLLNYDNISNKEWGTFIDESK